MAGGRAREVLGEQAAWRWASRQRAAATRWANHRRPAQISSSCFAPHAALSLRPDGWVHACCMTAYSVGRVTGPERQSLRTIWDGAAMAVQRDRLEADRFDLGCQECEATIASGGRGSSLAGSFDRWKRAAPMAHPKMIDFALSSRCNLQCVMCNGDLSSAIRTQREGRLPLPPSYDDAFFDELAEFIPHLERAQFKGGEPFLAPENRRVWDLMIDAGTAPETLIVTNGTVWNDDVAHYVEALGADVSISIDAIAPDLLEAIRVGVDATKLWTNVDRFAELAAGMGKRLTIALCFMTTNWQELPDFLAEAEARGVVGNVILVNQPDAYDLYKLPPAEIDAIADALEASRPPLSTYRAKRTWAQQIAGLRAQARQPVIWRSTVDPAAVPVAISTRRPTEGS